MAGKALFAEVGDVGDVDIVLDPAPAVVGEQNAAVLNVDADGGFVSADRPDFGSEDATSGDICLRLAVEEGVKLIRIGKRRY